MSAPKLSALNKFGASAAALSNSAAASAKSAPAPAPTSKKLDPAVTKELFDESDSDEKKEALKEKPIKAPAKGEEKKVESGSVARDQPDSIAVMEDALEKFDSTEGDNLEKLQLLTKSVKTWKSLMPGDFIMSEVRAFNESLDNAKSSKLSALLSDVDARKQALLDKFAAREALLTKLATKIRKAGSELDDTDETADEFSKLRKELAGLKFPLDKQAVDSSLTKNIDAALVLLAEHNAAEITAAAAEKKEVEKKATPKSRASVAPADSDMEDVSDSTASLQKALTEPVASGDSKVTYGFLNEHFNFQENQMSKLIESISKLAETTKSGHDAVLKAITELSKRESPAEQPPSKRARA